MKILDLPKQNRPRERFLKYGPETLSDAELFAIFLRTGTIGENVTEMSNRLIAEYGLDKKEGVYKSWDLIFQVRRNKFPIEYQNNH